MVVYEPFKTDNGNYYPPGATGRSITILQIILNELSKNKTVFQTIAAGWILASIAIAQIPAWGAWVVYNQEGITWWKARNTSFTVLPI